MCQVGAVSLMSRREEREMVEFGATEILGVIFAFPEKSPFFITELDPFSANMEMAKKSVGVNLGMDCHVWEYLEFRKEETILFCCYYY